MGVPWYLFIGAAVHRGLQKAFYHVGRAIYARPWIFMLCAIILGAALVPGQFVIDNAVTGVTELWVPTGAVSLDHNEYVTSVWGSPTRFQTVLFEHPQGSNIITQEFLSTIFDLHRAVTEATVQFDGVTLNYTDVCLPLTFGGTFSCFQTGILSYWQFNETTMLNDADLLGTISDPNAVDEFGRVIDPTNILGQSNPPSFDPDTGRYTSIPAVSMNYILQEKPGTEEWEGEYIKALTDTPSPGINVYPYASRSLGDALGDSIGGDLGLVFGAIGLILVYTMAFLGSFDYRFVKTRLSIAILGVLCALFGVYSAFGLCAWMGIIYGPPNQVLTFLIIGIGVDDMFIIVNEVAATKRSWDNKRRLSVGLAHAGASITLTSITNICAFAIGALSSLPAIQSFCIHAALAVFLDFVYQIAIFTAALAYDLRRQSNNRMDCCCCVRLSPKKSKKEKKDVPESWGQWVIGKFYAPYLVKLPVKIAVLVVFFGYLGFSIYMGTQVQREFRQEDLIPVDSDAYDFISKSDQYFYNSTTNVNVYFKAIDYHSASVQAEMLAIHGRMIADVARLTLPRNPWLVSFQAYAQASCNSTATKTEFYNCFNRFYNFGPGAAYQNSFVFFDNNEIESSTFSYTLTGVDTADKQLQAMEETRAAAVSSLGDNAFAYAFTYLFWEVFEVIIPEAIQNVASVLGVVLVVSLVFLIHPWTAVICTFVVAMILADLLGLMVMWDLNLDSVTVANLVMATGFAVDYSAHICHSFMVHTGSKNDRAIGALHDMGISVISGGTSTFLGIVLLAFSSSGIFVAFFKMFFGTVLFGLLHGLVLLPVILSLVGPAALPEDVLDSVGMHDDDDEDYDVSKLEEITVERQSRDTSSTSSSE